MTVVFIKTTEEHHDEDCKSQLGAGRRVCQVYFGSTLGWLGDCLLEREPGRLDEGRHAPSGRRREAARGIQPEDARRPSVGRGATYQPRCGGSVEGDGP